MGSDEQRSQLTELQTIINSLPEDNPSRATLEEVLNILEEDFGANQEVLKALFENADELINPDVLSPRATELKAKAMETRNIEFIPITVPQQVTLHSDIQYPRGYTRPGNMLFELITSGRLPKDAAVIRPGHYLIDPSQRPDYKGGQQTHKNHPFAPLVARLREEGTIPTLDRIPDSGSLFGISHSEWNNFVFPAHAAEIGANPQAGERVGMLSYAEFNVLGNLLKKLNIVGLGDATTGEYARDKLRGNRALYCGDPSGGLDSGGLDYVYISLQEEQSDYICARPTIFIPLQSNDSL